MKTSKTFGGIVLALLLSVGAVFALSDNNNQDTITSKIQSVVAPQEVVYTGNVVDPSLNPQSSVRLEETETSRLQNSYSRATNWINDDTHKLIPGTIAKDYQIMIDRDKDGNRIYSVFYVNKTTHMVNETVGKAIGWTHVTRTQEVEEPTIIYQKVEQVWDTPDVAQPQSETSITYNKITQSLFANGLAHDSDYQISTDITPVLQHKETYEVNYTSCIETERQGHNQGRTLCDVYTDIEQRWVDIITPSFEPVQWRNYIISAPWMSSKVN